jgi:hypothetical protein
MRRRSPQRQCRAVRRWSFPALGILLAACALLWVGRGAAAGPVIRSLSFHDDFEDNILSAWDFPFPQDWQILAEGPNHFLHMKRSRPPGVPRRPLQFALLRGPEVGSFEFQARLRREGKSLIIVFNYVDTLHFYYAHLSADRGTLQPVHNGVFIVDGGPRRRITGLEAAPALPDLDWHTVRVERDADSGLIEVFLDNSPQPLFSVSDRHFTCGRVGIGSFDETGDFDDVSLHSNDANCTSPGLLRPAAAP